MNFRNNNTINGQPLEFGNTEQIKFIKDACAKLAGRINVCEADWEFVRLANHTTETRKPITYYDSHENCDAVQCYIPCPKCGRLHKHVVGYDPHEVDSTGMWATIDEQEITCWNCGLEMYIAQDGSRAVFVRQTETIN